MKLSFSVANSKVINALLVTGAMVLGTACTIPQKHENPDPNKTPTARMRYAPGINDINFLVSSYNDDTSTCLDRMPDTDLPRASAFSAPPTIGIPKTDTKWGLLKPLEVYLPGDKPFTAKAMYGTGTYPGKQWSCKSAFRFLPKSGGDYEVLFDLEITETGTGLCKVSINQITASADGLISKTAVPFQKLAAVPNCKR